MSGRTEGGEDGCKEAPSAPYDPLSCGSFTGAGSGSEPL